MEADRIAFFILQTITTPDGQYIPCIAKEGERGYYRTDWAWGKDLEFAEKLAAERNKLLGLTEKDAHMIVLPSMYTAVS